VPVHPTSWRERRPRGRLCGRSPPGDSWSSAASFASEYEKDPGPGIWRPCQAPRNFMTTARMRHGLLDPRISAEKCLGPLSYLVEHLAADLRDDVPLHPHGSPRLQIHELGVKERLHRRRRIMHKCIEQFFTRHHRHLVPLLCRRSRRSARPRLPRDACPPPAPSTKKLHALPPLGPLYGDAAPPRNKAWRSEIEGFWRE